MIDCEKDCKYQHAYPRYRDRYMLEKEMPSVCIECLRTQIMLGDAMTKKDKNDIALYTMENEIIQQQIDSLLEKVGEDG